MGVYEVGMYVHVPLRRTRRPLAPITGKPTNTCFLLVGSFFFDPNSEFIGGPYKKLGFGRLREIPQPSSRVRAAKSPESSRRCRLGAVL